MKMLKFTLAALVLTTSAYAYQKCIVCNGTGWRGDFRCYSCNGTGQIGR
jgi:DnaJ-class molecular chaperone